ncbi:HNH endonuclease [Xenorhabdus griffiniae]|uniref:HNH endonuclease n=1 Tax=Xenorhabdus griffiniae TaxID=351672 RepID=A0ABY9XJ83_9GAMM|nr:HNH endonuclease [Xenorhabdus griffiniae]MBD1226749.1 HNH endonuclease [Xenorhabdus griffiniae]MBE8589388.1 HNH endonuclease [Xenorhabdus griffiniae]WMV72988.1 HNH endonuclease [Xenorhabdus griffiniae]WNH02667.1 HNH endonuclease [Xenorhabdus griffiniae]
MTIIFCNTGWMEHYDGIDGDFLRDGGSYNEENTGLEVCNFTNVNGYVYGYVQSPGKINIERLGAGKFDNKIDNITVVWLARHERGGTVVVGWYKNATVYREPQKLDTPSEKQKRNDINIYRIKALWDDAFLLPVEKRTLLIPRKVEGGIGQSLIWYADKPESKEHVKKVHDLIDGRGTNNNIPNIDLDYFGVEGNPRLRLHIMRERNSGLVNKKKESVLDEKGTLKCEVCNFDFLEFYGDVGKGFCEVHHLNPLHKSDGETRTELSDLAIVCSNCHRMIHRKDPMISIKDLSKIINQKR